MHAHTSMHIYMQHVYMGACIHSHKGACMSRVWMNACHMHGGMHAWMDAKKSS